MTTGKQKPFIPRHDRAHLYFPFGFSIVDQGLWAGLSFAAAKVAVRSGGLRAKFDTATFFALFWSPRPGCKQCARGTAIVATEYNERVVEHVLLFQRGNNPPDLSIQVGDHGGIGVPMYISCRILVGVNVLLRGLIRRMRCKGRYIEEQGL